MHKVLSLLLITLGFISGCSHTSSNLVSNKDMACIAPNIYVDVKMSAPKRQQFLQVVKQSKFQISQFFGGMKSNPDIYACSTQSCFKKFGGISARAKAVGDKMVLLSSKGIDKTTLSHELAHVELHKRLGSAKVWNKIPMWFDEGLAVIACHDPRYAKPAPMMPLNELVSQSQWVSAVRHKKPVYNVAKQAVENWYKGAGKVGLESIILRMQRGEAFSLNTREYQLTDLD